MENGFELLIEKEKMWAEMLMEVLKNNNIPCTSFSVQGAGFAAKTGIPERLKVYVPAADLEKASELMKEIFSTQ